MEFWGTVCFAPCACTSETAEQQLRASVSTRIQLDKKRLDMVISLPCQYRGEQLLKQRKSAVQSRNWTTLGKGAAAIRNAKCSEPVQFGVYDSLSLAVQGQAVYPLHISCRVHRAPCNAGMESSQQRRPGVDGGC